MLGGFFQVFCGGFGITARAPGGFFQEFWDHGEGSRWIFPGVLGWIWDHGQGSWWIFPGVLGSWPGLRVDFSRCFGVAPSWIWDVLGSLQDWDFWRSDQALALLC